MENLIQQLKDNERPFGLMSEEMQEKAKEIECYNFLVYWENGKTIRWFPTDQYLSKGFMRDKAYRLRADYEDEPEKIEVRIIRGDGYISPVSTSSISAHVHVFQGKKWVSLVALDEANKSIANAEYWLKKLNVWGNSDTVQKIYKLVHPEWDKDEDEPEIVECEIALNPESNIWGYKCPCSGDPINADLAHSCPGFRLIGLKFEDGMVRPSRVHYSDNSDGSYSAFDISLIGRTKILHATHVLFRRNKP